MKTRISAVAAAACVAWSVAVSGAAQDLTGVAQDRIPEMLREGAAGPGAPTLSGCVARGTAFGTYTLTSAARQNGGTAKDAVQPVTVILAGTAVDLAPHVGHSVSVSGTYVAAFGPVVPIGTAGAAEPPAKAGTDPGPRRTFTVKSLKMVGASCSEATE